MIFSDGTPWFVAKDVVEGLGLTTAGITVHMGRLKDEQKQKIRGDQSSTLVAHGILQNIWLISRGGFNDLVLESRKPVAREYRQWVTDEVLPALQDTGTFTDKNHPATLAPNLVHSLDASKLRSMGEEDFRGRRYHEPNATSFPLNEDDILKWAAQVATARRP